jgi:hypothetical protein
MPRHTRRAAKPAAVGRGKSVPDRPIDLLPTGVPVEKRAVRCIASADVTDAGVQTQIRISLPGNDLDDIRSLWTWLGSERAVRRSGRMRWAGRESDGNMGTAFDAIQLAVGSGLSIAQLVFAVAQWRASRSAPDAPAVEVEYRGSRVTITGHEPADVTAIVDALVEAQARAAELSG